MTIAVFLSGVLLPRPREELEPACMGAGGVGDKARAVKVSVTN